MENQLSGADVRKRGIILSILLTLFMISNLLAGILSLITALRMTLIDQSVHIPPESMSGWIVLLFSTFGLVNFVFLMAIWHWKRWGLFGFAGMSLIMVAIQLFNAAPPLIVLSSFTGVLLIGIFVFPRRLDFE